MYTYMYMIRIIIMDTVQKYFYVTALTWIPSYPVFVSILCTPANNRNLMVKRLKAI